MSPSNRPSWEFRKFFLDVKILPFYLASKSFKEWQAEWRKWKWMNARAGKGVPYEPTYLEHYANTLSHGLMIVPSILAGELMLASPKCHQDVTTANYSLSFDHQPTRIHYEISARIYGGALVGLFLVSTLFHWVTWSKTNHQTKDLKLSNNCCGSPLWEFFHLCDRAFIFIFISGSYTPWLMLNSVHPSLSWLRWGMWIYVLIGITYSFFLLEKYKLLEIVLYLFQGLLPALALASTTESAAIQSLSTGGTCYLCGVLLFKSDGHIPCAHALWHVFVAIGATSHFFACYNILY